MGLFSFLKNAGTKVFGNVEHGKAASPESVIAEKLNLLHSVVKGLHLPVEDLSLELQGDTVVAYGQTKSQQDKEKVILALGNVEGIAQVDDRISVTIPEPEATFYEVKPGDSLSKIAKKYYGDAMKYTVLFEANKPMLKDPNKIYPGQVLRIPTL